MVIEKWFDEVFVWSSENGNITIEIPSGWFTPERHKMKGESPLMNWKKKHQKELKEFKKLTGNLSTLNNWKSEMRKTSHENGWDINRW